MYRINLLMLLIANAWLIGCAHAVEAENNERAVAERIINAADGDRVLLLGSLHDSSSVVIADYSRYLIRMAGYGAARLDGRLIVAVHALAVEKTADAKRRQFFESYLADKKYVPRRVPKSLSELAKDMNAEISEVWPSRAEFRPYSILVLDDAELEGSAAAEMFRGTFKEVFAQLAKTQGVLYYCGDSLFLTSTPPEKD